jgi:hypothetical protein
MRRSKRSDVPVHDEVEPDIRELESTEGDDSAPDASVPSTGNFIGTAAVMAILVAAIAIALTLNREARQLPLVVAIPTLAMAAVVVIRDIVRVRRARSAKPIDAAQPNKPADGVKEAGAEGLSEAKTFGVFGAFILLYLALGFPWGASLFLVLYLLIIGKVGIVKSLLTTVCVVVPFHVVFVMVFHIPNYSGFLLQ